MILFSLTLLQSSCLAQSFQKKTLHVPFFPNQHREHNQNIGPYVFHLYFNSSDILCSFSCKRSLSMAHFCLQNTQSSPQSKYCLQLQYCLQNQNKLGYAAFSSLDEHVAVSSSTVQTSRTSAPTKELPSGLNHHRKGRGAGTYATVGRKPVPRPRLCGPQP
jgi:hypothetical protein